MKKTRISIIGGGASGMMCGATLLENNSKNFTIDLFEKNKVLGTKVSISGGGRCNVTTGINDLFELEKKYIRGWKFLKPAMQAFGPEEVRNWIETNGVKLKEQKDKRVFPESDRGEDIVELFEDIFEDDRINVHFEESVMDVHSKKNNKFTIKTNRGEYESDILVLTTGGNAYKHTGSTGDGYNFSEQLGHTVTKLGPSLNSFMAKEKVICKSLQGLSFNNAKIFFELDGKRNFVTGPIIFTHFGISGPAIFEFAAHIAFEEVSSTKPFIIGVSPDSDLNFEDWEKTLIKLISVNGGKSTRNILDDLLPARFVDEVVSILALESVKGASLSREQRINLSKFLSGEFKISLITRRPGDEFVTAGGVNTDEVDRKTMRSKINPNLFFAGEILNIDGVTGGFNLQSAWATGRMAGKSILCLGHCRT